MEYYFILCDNVINKIICRIGFRNPGLVLEEKPLRLAHRFAQQTSADSYLCYLLGSLETDLGNYLYVYYDDRAH